MQVVDAHCGRGEEEIHYISREADLQILRKKVAFFITSEAKVCWNPWNPYVAKRQLFGAGYETKMCSHFVRNVFLLECAQFSF